MSTDGYRLERDPWDRLVLVDQEGQHHVGVEPIRAFPISDPKHSISICNTEGRELIYIQALSDLPAELHEEVEKELARREFVPVITQILVEPPESEPAEWSVMTDRGPTTFQLDSEDDVHRNERGQVTIVDAHGIRYLIPKPRKLDKASRRALDRFL